MNGISRRTLMKGVALGAVGAMAGVPLRARAADGITVGIIYVGSRDDFGWNQAHAVGAQALKAMPGVTVIEEENVSETAAVSKTMDSMIALDGAQLIFGTSFGYFDPFMIAAAKQHPDVQFRHPTSLWDPKKHPQNLGGYYGYLDQAHYVNGIAAGLSTKTNKIGFIAAKPIAVVLRNLNAFATGVRKVNPNAEIRLIITGEWSLPVREAEASNALADAGCDVLACNVDSPKVIVEIAEKRGIMSCGHNANQSALAPKGFITGAELNWGSVYTQYADLLVKGEKLPNESYGGYDKGLVQSTPFGAGASEQAKVAALAAIEDLKAGKPYLIGPVKTNDGRVISETTVSLYDPSIWSTDYLVEGIVGSIT